MKNLINQFNKSAREVRLSTEGVKRMREHLIAHMREHPIPNRLVQSPYQRFVGVFSPFASSLRTPVLMAVLLLLVAVGGATTYATEGALPGDPLYSLKVSVLEPIRGLLAISPEEKAVWHASLVETRVSEVEQLAAKEKLTPEEGSKSQKRFDQSLQTARATLEKLSKENPEAAAKIEASFTASLDERQHTLDTIELMMPSINATEAHEFARHIRDEVTSAVPLSSTTTDEIFPIKQKSEKNAGKNPIFEKKRQEMTSPLEKAASPRTSPTSSSSFATSTSSVHEAPYTASTTSDIVSDISRDSGESLQEKATTTVKEISRHFSF